MGDKVKIKMRGYKAFDSDLTCRGHQYEIGKEYMIDGDPKLCIRGFHFCKKPRDCFNYYGLKPHMRFCKVEALGKIARQSDKCCTNHLRIVEEVPLLDILKMYNNGNYNFGFGNIGFHNIGNNNYGGFNTGDRNTGNYNYGNNNTGTFNYGNCNSGCSNIGDNNSGVGNIGDGNTGLYNRGDYNAGIFCYGNNMGAEYIFNKPLSANSEPRMSRMAQSYRESVQSILATYVHPTVLLYAGDLDTGRSYGLTDKNGGYVVEAGVIRFIGEGTVGIDAFKMWRHVLLTKRVRDFIAALPNFDDAVFKRITGVSITKTDWDNVPKDW